MVLKSKIKSTSSGKFLEKKIIKRKKNYMNLLMNFL